MFTETLTWFERAIISISLLMAVWPWVASSFRENRSLWLRVFWDMLPTFGALTVIFRVWWVR